MPCRYEGLKEVHLVCFLEKELAAAQAACVRVLPHPVCTLREDSTSGVDTEEDSGQRQHDTSNLGDGDRGSQAEASASALGDTADDGAGRGQT